MTEPVSIVYMGSGELACPALRALAEHPMVNLLAVISQPDRPSGRSRKLAACPCKQEAERLGIRTMTPEKIGSPEAVTELEQLAPDLLVVAAYGQYIPTKVLKIASLEAINIHPSLLPLYRGAAPIQGAIADGHTVTGCTILYVTKEMDAGDIVLQEEHPIQPDDTVATLKPRLAELGAQLLIKAVEQIIDGTVTRTPQDSDRATYISKLSKEDGRIDWNLPASTIACRVRGYFPWPGSYCTLPSGGTLKITRAAVEKAQGKPGEVLDAGKEGPLVAAGQDALRLLEVQPEGKKAMDGRSFLNGHALEVGSRFS